MKKHILKFTAKDLDNLEEIRRGEKWVETRAATPKYQNIQKGDVLVLRCASQDLEKIVKKAAHFESITEMLKTYKAHDIMPHVKDEKEMRACYDNYPNYKEKLKRHGIMAFEL